MFNVILISTVHNENGKCNSDELLKIIENISPNVIFEELSPNLMSTFYEKSGNSTLETNAIKSYLIKNPIPHIPVDLNGDELVDPQLKNKISKMLDIFRSNLQYKNLLYQQNVLTSRFGFPYLNSNESMLLFERSLFIEKSIIKQINNPELTEIYRIWTTINENREISMLENIYKYEYENKPKKALFMIGAAHRRSILEKIKNAENKHDIKLNWILNSL